MTAAAETMTVHTEVATRLRTLRTALEMKLIELSTATGISAQIRAAPRRKIAR